MKTNYSLYILLVLGFFHVAYRVWEAPNPPPPGQQRMYPVVPEVNLREKPSLSSPIIKRIRHGRWIKVIGKENRWYNVEFSRGKKGYILDELITDLRVIVLKDERQLMLMKGKTVLKQYPMVLGFNPKDDKIRQGDGCTPEGRFYICEVIQNPKPAATYGPVSLRISYPNTEDARRGYKNRLITKDQYLAIVKAIHQGQMPPQDTPLGSSIKIHGGALGVSKDWTWGCIAMTNHDITDLFSRISPRLTIVEIYRNRQQEKTYNSSDLVSQSILAEAGKLMKKGCLYTPLATTIIPIPFPMGDFDSSIGVCTDVVVRALRGINIDLQALLYEDILLYPRRYHRIPTPDSNIDHRRTRNLKVFFDYHAEVLTTAPPLKNPKQWRPGDIVIMDTGIDNGTIYDHIGIVSSRKNPQGIPLVINLWTIGWILNEMELLNGDYPVIVGHYRLRHPFYYGAL